MLDELGLKARFGEARCEHLAERRVQLGAVGGKRGEREGNGGIAATLNDGERRSLRE
jgi:hypothetical protein